MKKLIVPTDFSENALNALRYAAELFKFEECEIFLMHAYADEAYQVEGAITPEVLKEQEVKAKEKSDRELKKFLGKFTKELPDSPHSFKLVPVFELLIDGVNDLAEKENADLIVTSTHGETDDRKLTFGSNTLQIIKYVQCPVLSIPVGHKFTEPKKILFPTNFLLPYQPRELKIVGGLAQSFVSEVHMLYVSKPYKLTLRQETNKKIILDSLGKVNYFEHWEENLEKTEAITHLIEELNIDLLLLVNSRHSYMENILYSSTIDKIGLHPKIPFLVLQNFYRL